MTNGHTRARRHAKKNDVFRRFPDVASTAGERRRGRQRRVTHGHRFNFRRPGIRGDGGGGGAGVGRGRGRGRCWQCALADRSPIGDDPRALLDPIDAGDAFRHLALNLVSSFVCLCETPDAAQFRRSRATRSQQTPKRHGRPSGNGPFLFCFVFSTDSAVQSASAS